MTDYALSSGWLRENFTGRRGGASDLIVLITIAMHARPLIGNDLQYLVNLELATQDDEGRLYARVTDLGLSAELGIDRKTIADITNRLSKMEFISIAQIPENLKDFRDSHGRFGGSKVYILAGDLQARLMSKTVEPLYAPVNHRGALHPTASSQSDPTVGSPTPHGGESHPINIKDEDEEDDAARATKIFDYFAARKGLTDYRPTAKEQTELEKLLAEDFTLKEIIAAIDVAFERPSKPMQFTLCAAIARDARNPRSSSPDITGLDLSAVAPDDIPGHVFGRFAAQLGCDYLPSKKDRQALDQMLADGYSLKDIFVAIDFAFSRPKKPQHFTFVAILAQSNSRQSENLQPDSRQPEIRQSETCQPEPRQPETRQEPAPSSAKILVIEPELTRAIEVYRGAGRDISPDILARFRLMMMDSDQAARAAGSTGGEWLADALTTALGVAKPDNLINYAARVLEDWRLNGRSKPGKLPDKPKRPRKGQPDEPRAFQAIRDYLSDKGNSNGN